VICAAVGASFGSDDRCRGTTRGSGDQILLTSNPWSLDAARPQAAFNEVGMSGSASDSSRRNNASPKPTEIAELV
jgi:hypothetical protein